MIVMVEQQKLQRKVAFGIILFHSQLISLSQVGFVTISDADKPRHKPILATPNR